MVGLSLRVGLTAIVLGLCTAACRVGPDYVRPTAPLSPAWRADERLAAAAEMPPERWWRVFDDPVLDRLVDTAYHENLGLRAAGLRVIEAQARRRVAVGELFPQLQELSAGYQRTRLGGASGARALGRTFDTWQVGFDATWELDLWGRFRRTIESAEASLGASVADYDATLVSLVGEVAATYVQVRVLDRRIALAQDNLAVQRRGLDVAQVRFQAGGTSELDLAQATALVADTEAAIPELEIQRRQALDSLAILLGEPPSGFMGLGDASRDIPAAPPEVAVGIPADLLRRRPDVRRAERLLAAQSARIGIAQADLYPSLQLSGSIGFSSTDLSNLLDSGSLGISGGPRLTWPFLNYGRLKEAVRVEDATFQELAASYRETVLRAQGDVEDALIAYSRGSERVASLRRAAEAAGRAVDLSLVQYREGAADYSRVLTAQQAKLQADDLLSTSRGALALSVIALYKALGGGWELRSGAAPVPEDVRREMERRTDWGDELESTFPPAEDPAGDEPSGKRGEQP